MSLIIAIMMGLGNVIAFVVAILITPTTEEIDVRIDK